MIPDTSQALSWLEANPEVLQGIRRGIERETLRITTDGNLAETTHTVSFGAALTHQWITTDFAEAMLEFITPVDTNIDHLLIFLRDLHRYTARKLSDENMWPLSMPYFVKAQQNIKPATYGSSNIGRFKALYRKGLKNRYGALMQTISGVHYNFSLPLIFWQKRVGVIDEKSGKEEISTGYFRLIRNYHRFGWVIPYLFGASPTICPSFLKKIETSLTFKYQNGLYYLPYATSLRLSDLGYTNKMQSNLVVLCNDLVSYVEGLKRAINTPSATFAALELQKNTDYLQLNTNVLQIENELYTSIRPKRVTRTGESLSDALLHSGIEYIEVRSLDINPFSPIGVEAIQIRFLDLFLVWCALVNIPEMSADELLGTRKNWNRVILEGRKPEQTIDVGCSVEQPLNEVGKILFADLRRIARVFDGKDNQTYQQVCDELVAFFDNPNLTYSTRILCKLQQKKQESITSNPGLDLAKYYHQMLRNEPFQLLTEKQLSDEHHASLQRQYTLEQEDKLDFENYLLSYTDR